MPHKCIFAYNNSDDSILSLWKYSELNIYKKNISWGLRGGLGLSSTIIVLMCCLPNCFTVLNDSLH